MSHRSASVFPPGITVVGQCDDPRRVIVAGRPPAGFALLGVVDRLTHLGSGGGAHVVMRKDL
ncbi:hypothetical protein ACFYOK_26185 [Microbispora bryophytorum]|uniref:hypothetical protein n=1 Tax=Microbispora bryophytorum TaxID=1460882 RepID=UPI00340FBCF4